MKDEIKEILEDDGELIVRYKENSFECFDTLPKNVLDYINNLQEENERLNNIINELEKWYKKQYEDTNKCLDYAREHHNLQDTEKYTRDHNMFAMCMEKLDKLKELKEGK